MRSSPERQTILKTSSCLAVALLVAACASQQRGAPVEERAVNNGRNGHAAATAVATGDTALKPLPGAENAGKPGYYTIKPGDTLIRVGLETGQNWRDIMRWNNIDNPNVLEVGQVLRVAPPGTDAGVAAAKPVTTARVESRPLDTRPTAPVPGASAPIAAAGPSAIAAASVTPAVPPASAPSPTIASPKEGDDDVNWMWPSGGSVIAGFDEARNKGLGISGKAGDPVLAAADGRVVYAGSGLRGYGNLVIVKHNNSYLTAYAHNQTLLVKEDQAVRRGQKIAEMGSTDTDRVKLHFEIRRQGKPVDPAKYLPPR